MVNRGNQLKTWDNNHKDRKWVGECYWLTFVCPG